MVHFDFLLYHFLDSINLVYNVKYLQLDLTDLQSDIQDGFTQTFWVKLDDFSSIEDQGFRPLVTWWYEDVTTLELVELYSCHVYKEDESFKLGLFRNNSLLTELGMDDAWHNNPGLWRNLTIEHYPSNSGEYPNGAFKCISNNRILYSKYVLQVFSKIIYL